MPVVLCRSDYRFSCFRVDGEVNNVNDASLTDTAYIQLFLFLYIGLGYLHTDSNANFGKNFSCQFALYWQLEAPLEFVMQTVAYMCACVCI